MTSIDAVEIGFSMWRGATLPMPRPHAHSEIEINYSLENALDYFLSGRFQTVQPRQLAVFWAGAPHQLLTSGATETVWITLPLAWFLQWNLDAAFARRLLGGELLVQPLETQPSTQQSSGDIEYSISPSNADEALLRGWLRDLESGAKTGDARFQAIVLLELEARLRRLSLALDNGDTSPSREKSIERTPSNSLPNSAQSRQVEKLASFLSRHYQEEISVEDAARDAGLHPNYAMQVFKSGCGLTLGNYLQKLRLSHAQRLLLTTDWSVARVADDSGFESLSRFHAVFKAQCGQTPRAFRQRHEAD